MTPASRVVIGVAVLGLTGCGSDPQSPMDADQATERVEDHLTDAMEALPDSLEPEALGPTNIAPCEDDDLVTVTTRYWLDGLPAEDNAEHVEALHEYWTDNGYTVAEDQRPDDLFVHVRHEKSHVTMSVQESEQGDLSLGASSPCIEEHGADS